MLHLSQIKIHFEDAPAGSQAIHCDLQLSPGEICGITGPSGVGKSTLLLALAGFHEVTSGDMSWNGASFASQLVWDRPVSCLFQSDNVFPHLSVRKNISLAAPKLAKKHEIEDEIANLTQKLGIFDILDKVTSALSGGQQQRVGLARSLMSRKPILLLDEPFSALDDENRLSALSLVKQITTDHQLVTMIVTHDETDITYLGAKSLRLHRQPL
ncbi:MAG: ATP-binding cassette domain-containing protein [Candidatus Puniceispirillaceae bacterium]